MNYYRIVIGENGLIKTNEGKNYENIFKQCF